MNAESKVTTEHLQRGAYLYVRQSSLHQVLENTESTERQYALRRRAVALGWPEEQIVVIDHDQGQSGASAADRAGFQRLVADVGLGKAGIVMGLEVSRLARNCADWHRLLEICALTHTLILDEDGLYDPAHYNDRLLLGLKGTMSEAELHVLKARLVGGILNKAQRGELKMPLPIGLVYDEDERVEIDPDQQVQQSLRTFFATFERTGSAWRTIQTFREKGLKFPKKSRSGTGEIAWQDLSNHVALDTLHNPRYAGAFCYGRRRTWIDVEGKMHIRLLPREQWRFVKREAHPGYITWDEFLANQQRLIDNHQRCGGGQSKAGPAREGPALLQGLVLCGRCGRGMTVGYHLRDGRLRPDYLCQRECIDRSTPVCQRLPGAGIDEAIGELLIQSVTPLALEAALNVQAEIQARLTEATRLRRQQVQRAEYEAEQARIRYMRVDPNNRLVADTLEARWNDKLRLLTEAREECAKQERHDAAELSAEQKLRIGALATEFPKMWRDPKTLDRDRKRMARLLLEDVTLQRGTEILVQVRFKGGATHELRLPLPKCSWALRMTRPEIIAEIDRLLNDHAESEIARILNERGWRAGCGGPFGLRLINRLRRNYGLKRREQRLREQGWLTSREMAVLIGCPWKRIQYWRRVGLLTGVHFDAARDYLYQRPSDIVIAQLRARQRPHYWKSVSIASKHPSGAV
jgi:DNA invertase Pin-like site-specific DNA recombinase